MRNEMCEKAGGPQCVAGRVRATCQNPFIRVTPESVAAGWVQSYKRKSGCAFSQSPVKECDRGSKVEVVQSGSGEERADGDAGVCQWSMSSPVGWLGCLLIQSCSIDGRRVINIWSGWLMKGRRDGGGGGIATSGTWGGRSMRWRGGSSSVARRAAGAQVLVPVLVLVRAWVQHGPLRLGVRHTDVSVSRSVAQGRVNNLDPAKPRRPAKGLKAIRNGVLYSQAARTMMAAKSAEIRAIASVGDEMEATSVNVD